MKYLAVVLLMVSGFSVAFAQDIPLNHLYNRYKYTINPAALGIDKGVGLNLNYANNQFSEINAIQKFGFGVQGGFLYDNMAIGLQVSHEELNILQRTNAQFMYAYRFKFKNESHLTLGISAGLSSQGISTKNIYQGSGFDMSDPALLKRRNNATFGFGINYVYQQFELDLAVPSYSLINKKNVPLFAAAAYTFRLHEDWTLKPQVMYNGLFPAQHVADVRLLTSFKERVWLEVGYRSTNEFLVSAGVEVWNFRLDYMCGLNFGKFGQVNNGIHEVVLSYCFKNAKLKKRQQLQDEELHRKLKEIDANVSKLQESNQKQTQELAQINQSVQKLNEDLRNEFKGSLNEIRESVVSVQTDEVELNLNEPRIIGKGYFVVVYSTSTREDADAIVHRMSRQNVEGYVIKDAKRTFYYIYTSAHEDLHGALAQADIERKRGFSSAWVLILK